MTGQRPGLCFREYLVVVRFFIQPNNVRGRALPLLPALLVGFKNAKREAARSVPYLKRIDDVLDARLSGRGSPHYSRFGNPSRSHRLSKATDQLRLNNVL